MVRGGCTILAAAMTVAMGMPAKAEVLDAVYRGTLVCDKLPFTNNPMREAIAVTIAAGTARYTHVVRLGDVAVEPEAEQGSGTVKGQKIELQGAWKGGSRQYEAEYKGSFVRRHAKLKGTQTWTDGGKTITRACAGAITRPLRPFLPRGRKQA